MPDSPATPAAQPATALPGQPYCGRCGYSLVGATEASKCPECGAALVDCLVRAPIKLIQRTKRYTSPAQVFGMPLVQIAFGPDPATGEMFGRARGFIALGDRATGAIAFGGLAKGVVAGGGLCVGLFTMGGLSIGLISAAGGMTVGLGMSAGGMAVGVFSVGGMAVGYGAMGGMAVGRFAHGGQTFAQHTFSGGSGTPAGKFFHENAWFFGSRPTPVGQTLTAGWQSAVCVMGADVLATGALLLVALLAKSRGPREPRGF